MAAGAGTKDKTLTLRNRGINGGGVHEVRGGSRKSAFVNPSQRNGPQLPFSEVIAADQAAVCVVFIGINDVWWRKTTPEAFRQGLKDIVAAARTNKTIPVLATLSVKGELPNGANPLDTKCDAFAQITRDVAAETQTVLVDLRTIFMAHLSYKYFESYFLKLKQKYR